MKNSKKGYAPLQRLQYTSMDGMTVKNPAGEELGKVEDMMINLDEGKVEYVVMESGTFLGMGGKLFAIPFEALQVDPRDKVFILDKDKDYVKKSPGFDKSHWPATNDHNFYNDVRTYYGVVPPFP